MRSAFAAALALIFALCLPAGAVEQTPANSTPKRIITIGTIIPGHMGWAKRGKLMILPAIDRISEGRLQVKIYWGGIKGDEENMLRQIHAGKLSGAGFSGAGSISACPEFSVVSLPFLFRNWDEVDYLRTVMEDDFDRMFNRKKLKLLAWLDQDFDQVYSSVYDPSSLASLQKARFGLWYGPVEQHLFAGLGIKSVPIRIKDATRALRESKVDAALAPALYVLGLQIYPDVRYVMDSHLRYSPVAVVLSMDEWEMFTPEEQVRLPMELDDAKQKFLELAREDSQKCVDAMVSYGVRRVSLGPRERIRFEQAALRAWETMSGALFSQDLLRQVTAHLEEYRAAH
ncbi:MAG: TRAP transporter substrate-binding protein DctP [Deltaproteobacteria bacterium]|nr:TRAP transporter substrate-binding protein DctP [Deltaproteobacteria bacterium]